MTSNQKPDTFLRMKITLAKAVALLNECSAVIIDEDVLTYTGFVEETEEDTNEFLFLTWESEGLDYSIAFLEKDNQEVELDIETATLTMKDKDGEPCDLTLLYPMCEQLMIETVKE